jgi:glycosyltransferase involved in cell wall biosynthesis
MAPRVSIIVPAYNAAEYLAETLRSVEAQTFDDWEVVICNDASTDDTAEVAERFGERFRVVRNEENLGPAGARNHALSVARGELIALLDADDLWLPECLEEQVALYDSSEAEEPGVGIVTCDARIMRPGGVASHTFRDSVPGPAQPTVSELLVQNSIYGSFIVPRAIAEQIGGFSPECFGTEDHDLCVKVLERGYRAVSNPKALAIYRVQSGSVSSDFARMARNTQTVQLLALRRGHLSRRQRWVARRELRASRLIEEVFEIQGERASRRRLPLGRALRLIPRGLVVGLESPRRWFRVVRRLLVGKGSFGQRLNPGREDNLLQGS